MLHFDKDFLGLEQWGKKNKTSNASVSPSQREPFIASISLGTTSMIATVGVLLIYQVIENLKMCIGL